MPAHVFELLYVYYYLKQKLGKPPSAYQVADMLEIDFCTVLQRRQRAVACKVIVEPPFPARGDWAIFTDRGAEAFMAIMEGNEIAYAQDGTVLSMKRDIFPDDKLRYERLSNSDYKRYVRELAADEPILES